MKLGFIGAGNMATAILSSCVNKKICAPGDVFIYDTDQEKINALRQKFGVNAATSNEELIEWCDVLVLALKPQVCEKVLPTLDLSGKALVSIVVGWSMERLANATPEDCRLLRVMPNTPCMVGAGMVVFEDGYNLNDEEFAFARKIFEATGIVEVLPSNLMDAVTGVSGSGPAYVYIMIEAMADAGVKAGLPRNIAYKLAAQTVVGAGKMVLETGHHPGALKDAVCSPAGTTIEATCVLEQRGFRSAVIEAIEACIKRTKEL